MNVKQILAQDSIRLDLHPDWDEEVTESPSWSEDVAESYWGEDQSPYDEEDQSPYDEEEIEKEKRWNLDKSRQQVTRTMAEILYASGKVNNLNKLCTDMFNLEKRNPSAIGCEVAIPHLRCMQTTTFIMGFARYTPGIHYNAPDELAVRIFIPMIAPPYDDRAYLRFYKNISQAILDEETKSLLLSVQNPGEIIRILNNCLQNL